ncbi:MAG: glycosyltransferase [Candidatus Marinimicrobia bacterium]|nr:glycosyltransferase [Candidatus Neomarinimicrobiota bacterium]
MPDSIKKSITIISNSYPSDEMPVNGIFVRDQADWLSKKFEVKVLSPKPKAPEVLGLINKKWGLYSRIPEKSLNGNYEIYRPEYLTFPKKIFYVRVGKYFANAVNKAFDKNTDIVHVHFAYPGGCAVPELKKDYPDIPVVLTVHGNDWYYNLKDKGIREQIYQNLLFSDRIITVGKGLQRDIIKKYPEFFEKVKVIPNGINILNSKPLQERIQTFRKKSKLKILMVGSFVEGKGILNLFRALKESAIKDYELIIIGNIIDPSYYRKLLIMRSRLELDNSIRFIHSQPRNSLIQYYQDCDFFVLPSLREGFGIVLLEAMFYGKPVISTRSGGPDGIVNKKNGILVPPGDNKELAKALKKMEKEYQEYNAIAIHNYIEINYSPEVIVTKLMKVYNEIG